VRASPIILRLFITLLSLIYTSLIIPPIAYIPTQMPMSFAYGEYTANEVKSPQEKAEVAKIPIYERDINTTEDIKEYIRWSAEMMEIDIDLAEDLARIESNFDPKAQNPDSTAYNIYQMTEPTRQQFCVSDTYQPSRDNIKSHIQCSHRIIFYEGIDRWTISKPTCHKLNELGYVKLDECAYYRMNLDN